MPEANIIPVERKVYANLFEESPANGFQILRDLGLLRKLIPISRVLRVTSTTPHHSYIPFTVPDYAQYISLPRSLTAEHITKQPVHDQLLNLAPIVFHFNNDVNQPPIYQANWQIFHAPIKDILTLAGYTVLPVAKILTDNHLSPLVHTWC